MAKDPAFLFYTKDFYEGTRMMLPEERACLIDLLIYQHQNGVIPLDLKRISMYCSGCEIETINHVLNQKFIKTANGWLNKRLTIETENRSASKPKKIASACFAGLISSNNLPKKSILFLKQKFRIDEFIYENENLIVDETIIKSKVKEWFNKMLNQMVKNLANENENAIEDVNEDEVEIEKRGVGKKTNIDFEIDEVLNHFIAVTGKQIEIDRESNRKFVKARLKDKIPIEDLKKIIDIKTFKWKDDPKMREYIRIETLFNETKCNSYLTEVRDLEANPELIKKTYDYVKFGIKGQSEMALRKEQLLRGI